MHFRYTIVKFHKFYFKKNVFLFENAKTYLISLWLFQRSHHQVHTLGLYKSKCTFR